MSTAANWDTREYRRIVEAAWHAGALDVLFADGSRVTLDSERLLPLGTVGAQWDQMTFDQDEIVVPTAGGQTEIPWTTVRALTDSHFSAHLAAAAKAQAGWIGLRIRQLRQSRGLSGKELATRAGITPQSLSRIEHGHHDVVFTTLQRILAAMGASLKDLIDAETKDAGTAVAATGPKAVS